MEEKLLRTREIFFNVIQQSNINVRCLFVDTNEINITEDKKLFATIPPIPGIHNAHCISKLGHLKVAVFRNTGEHSPQIILSLSSEEKQLTEKETACSIDKSESLQLQVGDWCLVMYDGVTYPGEVVTVCDSEEFEVSVMVRDGKHYKWPVKVDKLVYSSQDILQKILPPIIVNNRGHFKFEDLVYMNKCFLM